MAKKKRTKNPFYPLLVLVGLVFAITACGFAMMMVRGINPGSELTPAGSGGPIQFLQEYGFTALMVELAVLALATFGAIATDEIWQARADVIAAEDAAASFSETVETQPLPRREEVD